VTFGFVTWLHLTDAIKPSRDDGLRLRRLRGREPFLACVGASVRRPRQFKMTKPSGRVWSTARPKVARAVMV
jgi:hypothetical protein